MASKNAFYVDGLTVDEILNLGDDVLNSLKARDMSRALRTVALAANKRVKRLEQYAKKRKGKYVEKANSPGIDLTALNHLQGGKFGVGNKNLNEMRQELARARRFMQSKASTVKGAKQLRQKKEKALFGQTREEMTKGMTKKEKRAKVKEIEELMTDVYDTYEDFKDEYAMKGGYSKESGSMILQDIGRDMLEGISPEAAKANAEMNDTRRYEGEEQKEAEQEAEENGDFFGTEPEWWELL